MYLTESSGSLRLDGLVDLLGVMLMLRFPAGSALIELLDRCVTGGIAAAIDINDRQMPLRPGHHPLSLPPRLAGPGCGLRARRWACGLGA